MEMKPVVNFKEYQRAAVQTPVCPDALDLGLPVTGLQQESGKIGRLVTGATSVNLRLSEAQIIEMRARFGDMLWYIAVICHAAGISMQDVAQESLVQLEQRSKMTE